MAILIMLSAWLLTASNVLAETVYKSTNEQGKITYSSSPPANHTVTVKVKILPPPSEQSVQSAQQRHQQNLRADEIFEENREKRTQTIADNNRIRREKIEQAEAEEPPEPVKEQGPYYGIPGHGILVLPKGPSINLK